MKYIYILLLIINTSYGFINHSNGFKISNKRKCAISIPSMQQNNNFKSNIKKNNIISWTKEKGILLYDIPATPEIWTIALVYFIQGLFGICRLALSFYYKDTLHLTPYDLTIISSISALPWIIKPLYGFVSDTFPLFGYKRKSYLALSGILSTISWIFLSNLTSLIENGQIDNTLSVYLSVFFVTLSSLGLAFSDVIVDAIVVNKSRDQEQAGALQSICWTSSSIGGIISAYFSGYLLQTYGTTFVFSLTALIPVIIIGASSLIQENKIEDFQKFDINITKQQIKNIYDTISKKSVLYPLLFLIIWNITPSAGSSLFYYEVNELGFKPDFFGKLGLISSISSLLGIVIYNKKLKSIPLRDMFKWTCIIGTILGMLPIVLVTHMNRLIGIPDSWFAIMDSIVLSTFGQMTFMPILVLAANMCPPGVEGMLYATIMSVNNLSGSVGSLFGGIITRQMGITNDNFINLPWLLTITNLSGLISLVFLKYIPNEYEKNEDK